MTNDKLPSLTIFFPFYNDSGTVLKQIKDAYKFGEKVTNDLEVIAIHGGNSKDDTLNQIYKTKKLFPALLIIDKSDNNEGYAVIKHGFYKAKKDWAFYTDGDAQYHLEDLQNLVNKQIKTNSDVINGYKIKRNDNIIRSVMGTLYAKVSTMIFDLPIRDTDCDFRLIRKSFLDKISLESKDSSILAELIKKLELSGAKFTEIGVKHYKREYGESNYTPFQLFKEKLTGDLTLYFKLKKYNPKQKLRIVKFGIVGLISLSIQFVIFNYILLTYKLNPIASGIISDQFAIISSFILNNHITFTDRKFSYSTEIFKKFLKFYSIVMVSTLIQSIVIYIGTNIFGKGLISSNIFFLIGIAIGFFWNYTSQKRFVYNKK